jgi:hypothetical protein
MLLITDYLPPVLSAVVQLHLLGCLHLPEDGQDLLPGQVRKSFFIFFYG